MKTPRALLQPDLKGAGDVIDQRIQVDRPFVHGDLPPVQTRGLQHLLDVEPQTLILLMNDAGVLYNLRHIRRGSGFTKHLAGYGDIGHGGLELVRHVVDEVSLDLGELLLPGQIDEQKRKYNQYGDTRSRGEYPRTHGPDDIC